MPRRQGSFLVDLFYPGNSVQGQVIEQIPQAVIIVVRKPWSEGEIQILCPDFSLLKRGATLNVDELQNWVIRKLEYNIEICGRIETIFVGRQPVHTASLCRTAKPVVTR